MSTNAGERGAPPARVAAGCSAPHGVGALARAVLCAALALCLVIGGPARAGEPQRLVVIGGALTEIVHALGAGPRIVGIDTSSAWPPRTEALPKVGYQRSLSAEGVLSLSPDLVLAGDAAGPPTVLEQLRGSGVRVWLVDTEESPAGLLAKVREVGGALGLQGRAASLERRLAAEMAALEARIDELPTRPRVAFLLSVGRGAPLAAGRDTAADAVIRLAGGINVLADYQGYKPVNAEAMVAASPDILLTTERTLELAGGPPGLLALPGMALTPAGRAGRVEAMDGLYLLGFGPRTPEALRELAARLHPEYPGTARADVDR